MHWFKRNIGDYHKKAGRLTMLQHGAYTLLMDSCYDREQFPTMEEAIEWVWASTPEEIHAVEFVLGRFFTLEEGVYIQHRISDELVDYQAKAETNKRIAIEREAKRKVIKTIKHEPCTTSERLDNESSPNQEPITINHKPVTNNKIDFSPLALSDEELKELKALRSKKKASLTQRVVNTLAKEFELSRKRGYTNDDILNEWSNRGWTSYKDEWMNIKPSNKAQPQQKAPQSEYDALQEMNLL